MKKSLKKMLACVLAVLMCFSVFVGCAPTDPNVEQINPNKSQLFVFNFNGGYGTSWLEEAKVRYEELHKDDVYEPGKKGIQIYINAQKTGVEALSTSIIDGRDEVFFTEYAYYYTLKNRGVLGDITDAVTADLGAYGDPAGTTIESKLTAEQINYFGVKEEDGETHYYGLPHYAGYGGLMYNVDMFEQYNYYFTANPLTDDLADQFIFKADEEKSAGPDGQKGTYDDGLPATYEQFWQLCEWISQAGHVPVMWNGANNADYLNYLSRSLAVDYEGLDQMMINYTLEGTAENLGSINGDGEFVFDAQDTTITEQTGNELTRQAGKYYSLKFMEKLIKYGGGKYHNDRGFNTAFSHMDAQDDFLYAGHDGTTKATAMLVEGIWWQSEATQTFNDMVASTGDQMSKKNRKFAIMPLPKATADKVGEGVTLYDHIYSMCFIKPNMTGWKQEVALDFIKFLHTNESLVKFTQITDTPKAMTYTMTSTEKEALSPFAKSVVDMKERADIVYPYSTNATYINNQSFFADMFSTTIEGLDVQFAAKAFGESDVITAEMYFNGLKVYRDRNWATIIA